MRTLCFQKTSQLVLLLLVVMTFTQTASATLDATGENLAHKYHCTTCHGDVGISNERRYPHLAAQNKTYLETRLRYFRGGTEPGQQMNGQAAPLTDLEIELIADYFSKQPGA